MMSEFTDGHLPGVPQSEGLKPTGLGAFRTMEMGAKQLTVDCIYVADVAGYVGVGMLVPDDSKSLSSALSFEYLHVHYLGLLRVDDLKAMYTAFELRFPIQVMSC